MENQINEQAPQPTREQMVQWYKDEIELATLRAELAKLQRDAVVYEAERINAIGAIAQMTQPGEEASEEAATPKAEPKTRTLKREAPLEEVH
jgi:hypothetical protein